MSVCHGHDVAAGAEARTGLQDEQAGTEMQGASGGGGWGWGCQKEQGHLHLGRRSRCTRHTRGRL